jgi:hypothetical protein
MPLEYWRDYGPWYPTAELRWRSNKLEQVFRRSYELVQPSGNVMDKGEEEEWREVPREVLKGVQSAKEEA